MDIVQEQRLAELRAQFAPNGRTRIGADNVDTVQVDDVLHYEEDHGYQGRWYENGIVTKRTAKSLLLEKNGGGTSRIALDTERLRARRVYRCGTKAEQTELRELTKLANAEQAEARLAQDIAKERERVELWVEHRAKDELATVYPVTLKQIKAKFRAEYRDCEACGWPGRKLYEGCLRCSDGF